MDILGRVKRLERAWGAAPCQLCGGRGRRVISFKTDREPDPVAPGCPSCGQVMDVIIRFKDVMSETGGRSSVTLTGAELGALYT